MSGSVSIQVNREDVERIKRDFLLMGREAPLAVSRAINRAVAAVNTEAAVQVRKYYNLTATRVRKNFKTRKATRDNLSAGWWSRGEPVGLIQFGARQNRKGVSVKVEVGAARKTVPAAFIRIGRNNASHVFWRELQGGVMVGRYDIHRLTGPRIEDALGKPEVQKALQAKADDTLQKRLDAEANYILSKARG